MDSIDQATELVIAQENMVLETRGGETDVRREQEIQAFTNCLETLDFLAELESLTAEEKSAIDDVLASAITRARNNAPGMKPTAIGRIELLPVDTLPSHYMADDLLQFTRKRDEDESST